MEYINRLLHRSRASSSPTPTSGGNDGPVAKTPEHEVKVRFAREFADVGPAVTRSVPESLSSASSFHSLSSTLSTKSSSGICPDTSFDTPDDLANVSYINSNIPGVEELILACADIHLGDEPDVVPQDINLSQDQTFASATDESLFHTNDCSLSEDLSKFVADPANEIQLIERNSQSPNTSSLSQTLVPELSSALLPGDKQQSASPTEEEPVVPPLPQESDDTSEAETRSAIKDSLLASNAADQLDVTATVSPDISFASAATVNEERTVESHHSAETLSSEDFESCATHVSAPSTSELPPAQQNAESPHSLPVPSSPLEDTDLSGRHASASPAAALSPDDRKVFTPTTVDSSDVRADTKEVDKEEDSPRVGEQEDSVQQSSESGVAETSEVRGNPQANIDTQDSSVRSSAALNETQTLVPEEDIAICNEARLVEEQRDPSETVIIQKEEVLAEGAASTVAKKEGSVDGSFDRTLTLQEIDVDFAAASSEDQYLDFKPQRQSTTLALTEEKANFEQFRSTAEKVTNDLLNSSLEFVEEADTFVSAATSTIFQDPSTFDFLLARSNSRHAIDRLRKESLYVKFDPLVSNASMLSQGNAQPINDEQNDKNESPLPNVGTPKRNPAIAAIDRLLFYSPLPSGTVQKLEEAQEKNEQPAEEPKSDAPLIADINLAEELELVRTTVLRLEEELEKQKKHEVELEKQKGIFQEKNNKLQAQVAQEMKMKTQMSVVVEEYEKSISRLLTERERDRTNFEQEKAKLQEELQAANHHLTNTEAAFNDVHQKYERLKGVVSVYKNNESVLKESIQENVDTIKTLETRYDQLKDHAMAQLEKANLELDGIRKQNEAETVKLHAMIRKAELKSNSLAELVEQKTKENKELAMILDEVIARVGHRNQE
ncbi:PREDICTED: transforming acidic coiled-coil-containing protein 2 isoform X2 [Dinoponera quadriceps]|uniref:Transforming acidic coiled-coil-containing protein 2 isoform X2 n=1 Tax=Dinoponera quadriceps TaxID=609295 RepID=A0A6P3Y6T3_DINQU|nr:PREDICTED: transforming acidic coiled-coil-containing protein 2 isoform X2 [Dinoponera quadriceps]